MIQKQREKEKGINGKFTSPLLCPRDNQLKVNDKDQTIIDFSASLILTMGLFRAFSRWASIRILNYKIYIRLDDGS